MNCRLINWVLKPTGEFSGSTIKHESVTEAPCFIYTVVHMEVQIRTVQTEIIFGCCWKWKRKKQLFSADLWLWLFQSDNWARTFNVTKKRLSFEDQRPAFKPGPRGSTVRSKWTSLNLSVGTGGLCMVEWRGPGAGAYLGGGIMFLKWTGAFNGHMPPPPPPRGQTEIRLKALPSRNSVSGR